MPFPLHNFEWLSLSATDLGPVYFDKVNENFVDVNVSSNYFGSCGRRLAFPVTIDVERYRRWIHRLRRPRRHMYRLLSFDDIRYRARVITTSSLAVAILYFRCRSMSEDADQLPHLLPTQSTIWFWLCFCTVKFCCQFTCPNSCYFYALPPIIAQSRDRKRNLLIPLHRAHRAENM